MEKIEMEKVMQAIDWDRKQELMSLVDEIIIVINENFGYPYDINPEYTDWGKFVDDLIVMASLYGNLDPGTISDTISKKYVQADIMDQLDMETNNAIGQISLDVEKIYFMEYLKAKYTIIKFHNDCTMDKWKNPAKDTETDIDNSKLDELEY